MSSVQRAAAQGHECSRAWGQTKNVELHKEDISSLSPHRIKRSLMARRQAEPGRIQEAPEVLCWVMFRFGSSHPLPHTGVGVCRCSSVSLGQVTCVALLGTSVALDLYWSHKEEL